MKAIGDGVWVFEKKPYQNYFVRAVKPQNTKK